MPLRAMPASTLSRWVRRNLRSSMGSSRVRVGRAAHGAGAHSQDRDSKAHRARGRKRSRRELSAGRAPDASLTRDVQASPAPHGTSIRPVEASPPRGATPRFVRSRRHLRTWGAKRGTFACASMLRLTSAPVAPPVPGCAPYATPPFWTPTCPDVGRYPSRPGRTPTRSSATHRAPSTVSGHARAGVRRYRPSPERVGFERGESRRERSQPDGMKRLAPQ